MRPDNAASLKIVLGVLILLVAYCAGAGQVDLWPGWGFAGFCLVMLTCSYGILTSVAPDLVVERVSWHAGVAPWDRPIVMWLMTAPVLAALAAGLEARAHRVEIVGSEIAAGYALGIVGAAWTCSAMAVNRFYTSVVRIQKERGHHVVTAGPYRTVRHPGNAGNLLVNLATPLMLASEWAWVPIGASVVVTIVRTVLEDRMLRDLLPGYREYAQRTRRLLIPGIW